MSDKGYGAVSFVMPHSLEQGMNSAWFMVNSAICLSQVRSLLREPGGVTYSLQSGEITHSAEPIELQWPRLKRLGDWCHRRIKLPRKWAFSQLGDWLSRRVGWPREIVIPSEFAWESIVEIAHEVTDAYVRKEIEEPVMLSSGKLLRILIEDVGAVACPAGLQVMVDVSPSGKRS